MSKGEAHLKMLDEKLANARNSKGEPINPDYLEAISGRKSVRKSLANK